MDFKKYSYTIYYDRNEWLYFKWIYFFTIIF
jgi:hypothetical protein